jgi:DNA-binding beta-propeller fold protein YncE/chitodextrinase
MRAPRGCWRLVLAALFPLIVVAVLLASVGVASHPSGSIRPAGSNGVVNLHPTPPTYPNSSPEPLAVDSPGTVARTAYVNYNATSIGNFYSSVDDWSVGPGAYVPSTGYVWLSDLPQPNHGGPLPKFAPAILYDPSNNSFAGVVDQLANTSDLLFDASNGLLYAALPQTNSVGVFNPDTRAWSAPPIQVGPDPTTMVLDNSTGILVVADSASSNLSLIWTSNNTVVPGTVTTSCYGPDALAIDTLDQILYVAYENTSQVSFLNSTTFIQNFSFSVLGHPGGLAVSEETNLLAITLPNQGSIVFLDASSGAFWNSVPTVGIGVRAISTTLNGSDFIAANSSGANLVEVDPASSTVINGTIGVGQGPASFDFVGSSELLVWSTGSRNLSVAERASIPHPVGSPGLGASPVALAYDPDRARVVVADASDNSLSVLSAVTFDSILPPTATNGSPLSLSYDSTTGTVFVGTTLGVLSFNDASGSVTATTTSFSGEAEAVQVDLADNLLWSLNSQYGLLGYSLSNLSVIHFPGFGAGELGVHSMALDPTTDQLFVIVNLTGTTSVAVVDASSGAIVNNTLPPEMGLTSLAYDPADGDVYCLGANISILNATTFEPAGPAFPIAPHEVSGVIAYDPSREYLYASAMNTPNSGTLSVIDGVSTASAYTGQAAMSVGQAPLGVLSVQVPEGTLAGTSEMWVANSGSGTLSIVASSPPKIDGFVAAPQVIDEGQSTELITATSGGAGPITLAYSNLPTGCYSSNTDRLFCAPTEVGTFNITVTATDVLGDNGQASTLLSVNTGIVISAEFSPSTFPELEVGYLSGISASASGGVGPYTYNWSFGDGTYGVGPSVYHSYADAGQYLLRLNVTDQVGGTGSDVWLVDVYAHPTLVISASTDQTDVGVPVSFSSTGSGGSGSSTTIWVFGDGDFANGTSASHVWKNPGLYNVTATYEDEFGDRANASAEVRVNAAPAGEFSISGGGAGTPARPGTTFFYNVTLFNGTGAFNVLWRFGDGSEAEGIQVSHAYSAAGNYTVNVTATDEVGASVNATLSIEVEPALTTSNPSGTSSPAFPLGVFLGVVIGATVAALVVFAVSGKKRKPKSPPPSPYVPPNQANWKED